MRNIFTFLIFAIIIFSCSKDDDEIKSGISGEWVWVESFGGIAGITETPATTGNQITIEFQSDRYKKFINGIMDVEMTYMVEKGSSIYTDGKVELIIYENEWEQSVELNDNMLILKDECYDCYKHIYIRE